MTFDLRDYGHVDHGYAATVHKAQGVTVDRAHVLATTHMDRHAAYVALTRHRDGVALHYAVEDFADPVRLGRSLSRERAKDTTLDYDGSLRAHPEAELVRRYAERRGLDPLHPQSEIVVPVAATAPAPASTPDAPAPRRGKFAGLKLGARARSASPMAPAAAEGLSPIREPASTPEPEPVSPKVQEMARGMVAYARAWADIGRMQAAGLPTLLHQAEALRQAKDGLEATGAGMARYVDQALRQAPNLAAGVDQPAGVSALAGRVRLVMEADARLLEHGHKAIAAWNGLEREYEATGKRYDWDAQRLVGTRMEAFAQALKRDPELEGLLKQRGRHLGIAEGSRLDQVVRAEAADWRLMRRLDIDHGPRMSSGPSPGL